MKTEHSTPLVPACRNHQMCYKYTKHQNHELKHGIKTTNKIICIHTYKLLKLKCQNIFEALMAC
jgi:hypothetical protein